MLSLNFQKNLSGFQLQSNFELRDKELLVILGPSGSGKSLTLQAIAGLIDPDDGFIRFGDQWFFNHERRIKLRTQERQVGYIFQNYALFPHMTVRENIAYGMKDRNRGYRDIKIRELLELMRLEDHGNKYPRSLSGGQQQRVAIARALAANPRLLLLDEPFSALDNIIRHKVKMDLLRIKETSQIPMILVTHDLDEAYTLGDRLLIMDQGRVLQQGTPKEVFSRPLSRQVAKFVGMKNIIHGKIQDYDLQSKIVTVNWKGLNLQVFCSEMPRGDWLVLGIRPEEVMLIREGEELSKSVKENLVNCHIQQIVPEGLYYRLYLRFSGDIYDLEMLLPRHIFYNRGLHGGQLIKVSLKGSALHILKNDRMEVQP